MRSRYQRRREYANLAMIALILAHPHIFWLTLGGLLLAAEMLGSNGYLLWSGVAGVVTGLLIWAIPLSWEWQGTLFAVLTLLAAWLWSKWLRKRMRQQRPADAQLNQRGQQLVGRRFTLDSALENGRGHVCTTEQFAREYLGEGEDHA